MKKLFWIFSLVASLGAASNLRADSILWVSDNGLKGTISGGDQTLGVFYPAASTNGTPFVDQGFVDMLIAAGHSVTRYNPNGGGMSTNDVPLINSYDLIILGSALNSGPFNLNARGPKWNTLITKPMIITKSTLIRRDRMGYIRGNFEYDCGADSSTTMSGKLTLKAPSHPIFQGISRSTVGMNQVMDNYDIVRVSPPVNNRGVSVQFFNLVVNGVDQSVASGAATNTVETGGTVLATIDFNPMNPGVNIPAGQLPAVDTNYQATGYAIVEWPAGTIVRTTQLGAAGETNASYRMLFACGTRDASGSNAGPPNPEVGALDLTPDGKAMFLNAVRHALAQGPARLLASTWGQWDYKQYLYGGTGNLVVSNETAGGFTAWVGSNTVDAVNNTTGAIVPDGVVESAGRPTIFQEFSQLDLSQEGQKMTATYDIKFNNAMIWSDQFVRFGFGNTNNNTCFYLKMDSGLGGGTTLGWRSGMITETNGTVLASATFNPAGNLGTATNIPNTTANPATGFIAGNYSRFMNSGSVGNLPGAISAYPNGVGLGVDGTLDVVHTVSMSMERVIGGLKISGSWSNSAGPQVLVSSYSSPFVDAAFPTTHGKLDKIGCLGFNLMNSDMFATNGNSAGGTYRVSNFRLDYTNTPPFRITGLAKDPNGDLLTVSFNSFPGVNYSVEYTDSLSPVNWLPFTDTIPASPITATGTNTTIDLNFTSPGTFYRIRKQ